MTRHRNCEGITRRDCLKLGLGALLGGRAGRRAAARRRSAEVKPARPAKACILIWMDGGPSHYETFDPKPKRPPKSAASSKPIATKIPGVQFSQHMQQLAAVADKFAVVRSIRHDQGNHGAGNHYMMTGAPPRIPVGCGAFVSFHPSLGSVVGPRMRDAAGPAGLFLDAPDVALRRAELPRRAVRPVRRRREPQQPELPRPRRGPSPRV